PLDELIAFEKSRFLVPESLWNEAGNGLEGVVGVPARDELELASTALRRAGEGSRLEGIVPVRDAAPRSAGALAVLDLAIGAKGKPERYRLTAAKINGRWFVAHLLSLSAEDDAKAFLEDLFESQKSFYAFHSGKYARSLLELASARKDLEGSENLKAAGLTFPFGARLDRLERDQLSWSEDELRGPFFSYRVVGDVAMVPKELPKTGGEMETKSSWRATATPRTPSYRTFSLKVSDKAKLDDPVEIKATRAQANEK
ncbi:hypothetical protein HY251_19665, partial [bacterium]|nr:hypothetical protein [bacterium]